VLALAKLLAIVASASTKHLVEVERLAHDEDILRNAGRAALMDVGRALSDEAPPSQAPFLNYPAPWCAALHRRETHRHVPHRR
jgi:hypothetical protein